MYLVYLLLFVFWPCLKRITATTSTTAFWTIYIGRIRVRRNAREGGSRCTGRRTDASIFAPFLFFARKYRVTCVRFFEALGCCRRRALNYSNAVRSWRKKSCSARPVLLLLHTWCLVASMYDDDDGVMVMMVVIMMMALWVERKK